MTVTGHDEGMTEENTERTIGRNGIGFGHHDHARLEYHVDIDAFDVLGTYMRVVGDEIDAVALGRARLHALVAEELRGRAHVLGRFAGRDLGDDFLVPRQRDLVPELAHHVSRLAHANR